MVNFEEKILTKLVHKYRSSRKDLGTNTIHRATRIRPKEIYRSYESNDVDYTVIEAFNSTAKDLSDKGFAKVVKEPFGTRIQEIILVDAKIEEIERYLSEHYDYVSKDTIIHEMKRMIRKYENKSLHCKKICEQLRKQVSKRKTVRKIQDTEDVLKALAFIETNTKDLYVREASMHIYGDSKYLENTVLQMVCHILRDDAPVAEGEMEDEILQQYHIYKEPRNITIKGNCSITIHNSTIDITPFAEGITFSAADLSAISAIHLNGHDFMTIENRTAWMRYSDEEVVTMYLGGYADRFERDFIRKVYTDNRHCNFLHFGDIDPGGFWIHHHLVNATGVPFQLFAMSKTQLQEKQFAHCLHTLSDNDIARLQNLKDMEPYKTVVQYMLEKNVKLEQEIIALDLMHAYKR